MDGWNDKCMGGWIGEWSDERMDRFMGEWMDFNVHKKQHALSSLIAIQKRTPMTILLLWKRGHLSLYVTAGVQ